MVIIKVLSIFLITGIGFGASKIGWLPRVSAVYLGRIVINIACPCVVLSAMISEERTEEKLWQMLTILVLGVVFYFFEYLIAGGFTKALKIKEDRGIYKNFLIFTNNGFMGYPIVLAIFGKSGMFAMIIINTISVIFIYSMGVINLGVIESKKDLVKHLLSIPITSSLLAILLFVFEVPVPDFLVSILDSVGALMAPLAMMVIGIQLADSHLGKLIRNAKIMLASLFRLIIIPILVLIICLLLLAIENWTGLNFGVTKLLVGVMTLNFLLPCGATPATLAEEHEKNGTLAAEGTFLTTFFSIGTVTAWTVVFHLFL
jgi:predicted permease